MLEARVLDQEPSIRENFLPEIVLTITEISQLLKRSVETQFAKIKIRGEISSLKVHSSGNVYFSLKDNDAVLDAVFWKYSFRNSSYKLEDGLEIIATGKLTVYPGRSKYQFVMEQFEPAGQGALLKLLQERKEKLEKEGLFSQDRKKQIPRFPKKIGVITSPTGAVIRDILHRIEDRFPTHILLWPVLVQGKEASDQVTFALNQFNSLDHSHPQRPDLIIVARGGGSIEDLWAFNEENVVRAVANSTIPIISAIGHETDTTLIDFAADLRAPTPTAAAELSVPVRSDLVYTLQKLRQSLLNTVHTEIERRQLQLSLFSKSLIDPRQFILETQQKLDDWHDRMERAWGNYMLKLGHSIELFKVKSPLEIIPLWQQKLQFFVLKIQVSLNKRMDEENQRLTIFSLKLDTDSPKRIFDKGFSWITDSHGKNIKGTAGALKLKRFTIHFADGQIEAKPIGESEPHLKKPFQKGAQGSLF